MEAAIKRILPHSTEAEQAVVGAMLMDKDAIMVAAEMSTPRPRQILSITQRLSAKKQLFGR